MSCMITDKWGELEESTDRKEAGYANLYQVCDNFVKPWTLGTGNSIALLMNAAQPLQAKAMISHAWGESVLEALTALLAKCFVLGMSHDTPIWFCTFAQYQPGDTEGDCGPTVAQQLALDPFQQVIHSNPHWGMLVVHTSHTELYGRLWCVYEVNEAETARVRPAAALSMLYGMSMFRKVNGSAEGLDVLRVQTSKADCWSASDAEMIRSNVEKMGGFSKLDEKIFKFRMQSFNLTKAFYEEFTAWFARGFGTSFEDGLKFILDGARRSAQFVGLHHLTLVAQAAGDKDTLAAILKKAHEVCSFFHDGKFVIPPSAGPPPRFDLSLLNAPDWPRASDGDEDVLEKLRRDPSEKPTYLAWTIGNLVMVGGGVADPDAGEQQTANLLSQFRSWDDDGSGTITKVELSHVLRKLNPEFSEGDMDELFSAADLNKDGLIDYKEFVSWLSQG